MNNVKTFENEHPAAVIPERRRDIDLMRALMVLGLILFHTARIFDLLPFYVKNDELSLTFMILVGFASQWGMPLFFLISGIAVWHALSSLTAGQFIKARFRRLIVPLIFGIFVLVPPQHYYNLKTGPDYAGSFWEFYPTFIPTVFRLDFPWFIREPAHLWFLYYLFIFSMISLPVFVYLRGDSGRRLVSRLAAFCQKPGAIFLLALPIIAVETFVLEEESTGWNRYAYIPFLMYGFLFASDSRFDQSLRRHRIFALTAGTLCIAGFFGVSVIAWKAEINPTAGYGWQGVLWRLLKSCSSWVWIVAILGWVSRFRKLKHGGDGRDETATLGAKDQDHQSGQPAHGRVYSGIKDRILRYANEAVLPFYVIHQTVIVVIGFYVVQWSAGILIKYVTIVSVTFLITLSLYLFVRQTTLTRFLFGMKPRERDDS